MRKFMLGLFTAALVTTQAFHYAPDAMASASYDPAKARPPSSAAPASQPVTATRLKAAAPTRAELLGSPDIIVVDDVNYVIANSTDGSSINWVTGATCDCDTNPGFHFNPWSSGGNLAFWWWNGTDLRAGVSFDGTTYAVLGPGDVIGPASTFISAGFPAGTVNWRQADNVDGYLGFRFDNGGTTNYGYVRLTTTGTTGHPATIVSYAYNSAGGAITIPLVDPVIDVAPAGFNVVLNRGELETGSLVIDNIGGGSLDWSIDLEGVQGGPAFDPALDEPLSIPDFTVISPANSGTPHVVTVPAGVLTNGRAVGFSFEGTVSGITGNSDWASDLCLQVEGPDGSSFSVGGIGAVIPNCNINNWAFQGGGSTNDGTYSSSHVGIWPFPPGAQGDGDWTFTFIHGWNSTSANPMNWSNVTITLHKFPEPEPCDFPGLVSWLGVDPDSGSALPGSPSIVDVLFDASNLAVGNYSANICISSNDTEGNDLLVLPVELTVVAPEIEVTPASLSATVFEGESTSLSLDIANLGTADLHWSIDEAVEREAGPRSHFPTVSRQVSAPGGTGSPLAEIDPALLAKLSSQAAAPGWSPSAVEGGVPTVPAFTTTGFSRSDYVSMNALVPGALNTIIDPQTGTVFAQTFIDDDFSQHFFIATGGGTLAQNAYGFVDTSTGAVNQLGVLSGVPATGTWVSAAWDPTSGTVYAVIVPGGGNNQLFVIDVDTGTGTLVGTISGLVAGSIVIAIAIDAAGLLYGLEIIDDVFIAIDKTDATGAVIGPVGVNANFAQDMDFDRSTGTLYWASYLGGGNSNIRIINTSTGATSVVGPIESGAELLSFSIAVPSLGGCEAPSDVPWLSLDVDAGTNAPGTGVTVEVTLDSASLDEGVYSALLCVNSNDPDNPLVQVPVEFEVQVQTDADLGLTMSALAADVPAGGAISLTATVANAGPALAESVSVELTLPAGVDFVSGGLDQGSGDWACSAVDTTVTCELTSGSLPVDGAAAVLLIDLAVDAEAAPGQYEVDGVVIAGNGTDPDLSNNEASASFEVLSIDTDLAVALSAASQETLPGGSLELTASVSNAGPAEADEAVLTITLPAGFALASGPNASGDGTWDCGEDGGVVTCELVGGTLSVGTSVSSFSLVLQADNDAAVGDYTVEAEISAPRDPELGDNQDSLILSVIADVIFSNGFEP